MQGYIKDFRKELDSNVWMMPPLYHRTWQYLKYKVNHQENTIPMRDGSFLTIKAGQHLTSVRDIAKNVGWYEGVKWKEPNPKTITTILEWLVKQEMISIDKGKGNRQYTLITLLNWELYQFKENEGNSDKTQEIPENPVKGNSAETVETQSYQGVQEEKGVSSNSSETAREHLADINKNDKECFKNDLNTTTTSKGHNPVRESSKLNNHDAVDEICERFINLRSAQEGRHSYPNAKDYQAIARVVAQGVPLSQTIKLLEQCFEEYTARNPDGVIKVFSYCEKYIIDHYRDLLAREEAIESSKNVQPLKPSSPSSQPRRGRTKPVRTEMVPGWLKKEQEDQQAEKGKSQELTPEQLREKQELEAMLQQYEKDKQGAS